MERKVLGTSSKGERRGAPDDSQFRNLRQEIDNFLCHAIGKVLLVFLFAHVKEWQDSDRLLQLHHFRGCGGTDGRRRASDRFG